MTLKPAWSNIVFAVYHTAVPFRDFFASGSDTFFFRQKYARRPQRRKGIETCSILCSLWSLSDTIVLVLETKSGNVNFRSAILVAAYQLERSCRSGTLKVNGR